jgi:hypothetical protein
VLSRLRGLEPTTEERRRNTSSTISQRYLNEFEFRCNRRKTKAVARLMARRLHNFTNSGQMRYEDIIARKTFARLDAA